MLDASTVAEEPETDDVFEGQVLCSRKSGDILVPMVGKSGNAFSLL